MKHFLFLIIALILTATPTVTMAAAQTGPLDAPDLGNSPMVKAEVGRIYSASPDANALVNAFRNKVLSLDVLAISTGLYGENYEKGVSPTDTVFTNHFGNYCAKSSPNDQIPGGNCQDDALLQHGDIKASSILSGSIYGAGGEQAAKAVLNNLIEPFPSPSYLDPTTNQLIKDKLSDFEYRKQLTDALTNEAILSGARLPLAEMIARRVPVNTSKGAVSMMSVMEQEAVQRFYNDQWIASMIKNRNDALTAKKPEAAVLYEIALMDAFRNLMAYETFVQNERIQLQLSTLIALQYRQAKAAAAAVGTATSAAAPQ